jgi:hypothetical protein
MGSKESSLNKSNRTFSKRVVLIFAFFGAGATIYSIYSDLSDVAIAGFAFVTTLITGYSTVGHLDYRKVLDTYKEIKNAGNDTDIYSDDSESLR